MKRYGGREEAKKNRWGREVHGREAEAGKAEKEGTGREVGSGGSGR